MGGGDNYMVNNCDIWEGCTRGNLKVIGRVVIVVVDTKHLEI